MNKEYIENIQKKLNKVLKDELSAMAFYYKAENFIHNIEISKEISSHGDEEGSHFKKILNFCYKLNLDIDLKFDNNLQKFNGSSEEYISKIQNLEKIAIKDYKEIVKFARENGDVETENFFIDILNDEISHFDDIAVYTKETRKINENLTFKGLIDD